MKKTSKVKINKKDYKFLWDGARQINVVSVINEDALAQKVSKKKTNVKTEVVINNPNDIPFGAIDEKMVYVDVHQTAMKPCKKK